MADGGSFDFRSTHLLTSRFFGFNFKQFFNSRSTCSFFPPELSPTSHSLRGYSLTPLSSSAAEDCEFINSLPQRTLRCHRKVFEWRFLLSNIVSKVKNEHSNTKSNYLYFLLSILLASCMLPFLRPFIYFHHSIILPSIHGQKPLTHHICMCICYCSYPCVRVCYSLSSSNIMQSSLLAGGHSDIWER